ncbi:MAG: serine/threonine-protein phosphatase [Deltaproteobacteria bacterium]|nr:serine/threonine-protein phosphatase [Deltaproteobacteria bacterium]
MDDPAAGPEVAVTALPQGIVVRCFARTDVGLLREHNEDDFLVADLTRRVRTLLPDVQEHALGPGGSLFVVCDGMGGAAAGEVASRTAVDTIYERLTQDDPPTGWDDLVGRLDLAIIEAGHRIYQMARVDQERRGMGTTCTAAALVDGRLFVHQVGDSRCYVLRRDTLLQLTRDQSLLTQLIEAGQVKPEDAANFEHSNIILQALGTTEMVNTDVTFLDLRRGDSILLCSDGLSGMIDDDAIRMLLSENPEPLAACRALTEAANHGGGEDNITVVVARFDGAGLPEPGPEEPLRLARFAKPRPPNFDRVPYTIPEQLFADGGPAVPMSPEVPMGAVSVEGMIGDEGAAVAAARPTGPVESRFDGTASDLAEALRGAAEAPRVIEWSDEDVSLDDLPTEIVERQAPAATARSSVPPPRPKGSGARGWTIVALLLLALIVLLLVFDSIRERKATEAEADADGAVIDIAPIPPPPNPESRQAAPTTPRPQVPGLRPGIDLRSVRSHIKGLPTLQELHPLPPTSGPAPTPRRRTPAPTTGASP